LSLKNCPSRLINSFAIFYSLFILSIIKQFKGSVVTITANVLQLGEVADFEALNFNFELNFN